MVVLRKIPRKPVNTRKITFQTFLRHARALGAQLGGDHTHSVEFEPQNLGLLGRFRMVHENEMTADQYTQLDNAAKRAGMHGFREKHVPRSGRTGSITIVFDATQQKKIRNAFRTVYHVKVRAKDDVLKAEYRR